MNAHEARAALLALLAKRHPGATICPSEVARAVAGKGDWRAAMPLVHASVDDLLAQRHVQLSWKGRAMTARSGPYRVAAATPDEVEGNAIIGAAPPAPSRTT